VEALSLPLIAIVVVGAIVAYILWKVTTSAHSKMAEILSKGTMDDGEK
jgi:mannose/fructose/N-acetylgalactosamine-specific phosphotransferase system component IIC